MITNLNFEDEYIKKLLCQIDFEFFLKQNFRESEYSSKDIDDLYEAFHKTNYSIKKQAVYNKNQFNLYVEGKVRKMFTGGLLPSLFGLNEVRELTIYNFNDVGESFAYFNYWQKYYRKRITLNKIWDIIVKIGSILAIVLTILKCIEVFGAKYL